MINKIPNAPSVKEAVEIANIFDNAGYYNDADLMDTFVKQASNVSLDKRASLWSGIWNRLGGWARKVFFKEYRQLYKYAKEANAQIKERFDEAQELWKEAQNDFKNYELVAWREKILKLPMNTKDLMENYEIAFGNLIQFTFKLKQKEEEEGGEDKKDKSGIMGITPPGEGGEGVAPDVGKPTTKKEMTEWLGRGWGFVQGAVSGIQYNSSKRQLAITKPMFDLIEKHNQIILNENNLYQINPVYFDTNKDLSKASKLSRGVMDAFGNGSWKLLENTNKFIVLEKEGDSRPQKIEEMSEKPDLPVGEQIGEPSLPKMRESKEPKLEEIELEEISEEQPQVKSEEIVKAPEGQQWVVLLTGKDAGKAALRGKTKGEGYHWVIKDENLINQLNNRLQQLRELGVKKAPLEDPKGQSYGVPKEAFEKAKTIALKRKEKKPQESKEVSPEGKVTEMLSDSNDMSLSKLFDSVMDI